MVLAELMKTAQQDLEKTKFHTDADDFGQDTEVHTHAGSNVVKMRNEADVWNTILMQQTNGQKERKTGFGGFKSKVSKPLVPDEFVDYHPLLQRNRISHSNDTHKVEGFTLPGKAAKNYLVIVHSSYLARSAW